MFMLQRELEGALNFVVLFHGIRSHSNLPHGGVHSTELPYKDVVAHVGASWCTVDETKAVTIVTME